MAVAQLNSQHVSLNTVSLSLASFFQAVRETLGSRNRHSRSRAKPVRSSQVDRESWQRLITMNNEWLTGSLYKELFRFRHTLTIFSLPKCELQGDLYQPAFTIPPLPLLNKSNSVPTAIGVKTCQMSFKLR